MMRIGGAVFLLLLAHAWAWSGESATIAGRIVEKKSRQPIPGVNVLLQGTKFGVCANESGYFELTPITPGTYMLHVSVLGYEPWEQSITLREGERKEMRFELTETVYQMNVVQVTATKQRSLVSEVPASVEIMSARELQTRNIQDISDAVSAIAGVYAKEYGGLGGLKTASIRGSSSSQVLVLVDGQRVNNAQSGDVDLSTIPVEGVERIEVVRGGSSALYGADAVGGVINVLTKTRTYETSVGGDARFLAGSFGTRGVEASGNASLEKVFAVLSYKYLQSDGDFPYTSSQGKEERLQNADMVSHGVFAKGTWNIGEEVMGRSLTLSGQYYFSEAGVPGTIDAPKLGARKKNQSESLNLVYEQKVGSPYNTVSLQSYFNNVEFNYDDTLSLVKEHSYNHNIAFGAEARGRFVLADWSALTAGYAYRRDELTGTATSTVQKRGLNSLYAQMELAPLLEPGGFLRRVIALPAVRWDHFSDFGGEVSPKIGLVVATGEESQASLKLNYGLSYRAPSFNDLYWPKDAYSVGNPNLKPEEGEDFDIGTMVRYPPALGLAIDLTYFSNSITDMILWQQGATGLWSPENVGKASIKGVEAKVSVSPWKGIVHLAWSYTYLDARNKTDKPNEYDMQLPNRAKHAQTFSLRFDHAGAYAIVDVSYTGKRYVTTANTVTLPAYTVTDGLVGYRLPLDPFQLDAKLEVRNIGDVRYQVMEGFAMPGREIRFSLNVAFSRFIDASPSQEEQTRIP